MDMTKYASKQFLTVETVQNEQVFFLNILNEGTNKQGLYGDQAVFEIDYNGKDYLFSLNGESVTNLIEALGPDSRRWIGKTISIGLKKNKNDNFIIVCEAVKGVEETKIE